MSYSIFVVAQPHNACGDFAMVLFDGGIVLFGGVDVFVTKNVRNDIYVARFAI